MKYEVPIAIIIFFVAVACSHKETVPCPNANLPMSLFFQIKITGHILSQGTLNFVKLSYINNGTKEYVNDLIQAVDNYANKGIVTTRIVGVLSANQNIKTFYLEFPDSLSTDTLYIDYSPPSSQSNCLFTLRQVKYNNQTAPVDTSFTDQPVYVFNKP